MVKPKLVTRFKCPYCGQEFDNEEDCEDCIEECNPNEDPIEIQTTRFFCKYCNGEFETETDALICENTHSLREKRIFNEEQERKENEMRLIEASEHPCQIKLDL